MMTNLGFVKYLVKLLQLDMLYSFLQSICLDESSVSFHTDQNFQSHRLCFIL